MEKFLAVATSMAMALSLLTACGSNATSIETTTVIASGAASEKETAGKEVEESEPTAETAGTDSTQFQSSILFCGSTSLCLTLPSLVSSFTEKHVAQNVVDPSFPDSNISVYVAPDGSGVGVSAAIDDTADFGMLTRDIRDSEVEAPGEHYQELMVAKDTLIMSVSVENPIYGIMDDMPVKTIRRIFAGETVTWDQTGSTLSVKTINVYIRDLFDDIHEVFQKSVMDDSKMTASAAQPASMTELATNIIGDKWGVDYAGSGAYNKASADGQALTVMKVDGVKATAENIISGVYTTQRPVMFVVGAEIIPSGQALIDYIFSQTGYGVMETSGYTPAFTLRV